MSAYRLIQCVDAPVLAARYDELAAAHARWPSHGELYAASARQVRADGSCERTKATLASREAADALAARMNEGVMPGVRYRVEAVPA